jgi:hypothetical protein
MHCARVLEGGECVIDFMRPLSLVDHIQQVHVNEMPDVVKWNFEKSGVYTVDV